MTKAAVQNPLTAVLNAPQDQPFAPPAVETRPPAKVLPIPTWCIVNPKLSTREHPVALSTETVLLRFAPSALSGPAGNVATGDIVPLPTGCSFQPPTGYAIEVCCVQSQELTDDPDTMLAGYRLLPGYVISGGFKGRGEVLFTLGPIHVGAHKSVTLRGWTQATQHAIEPTTIIGVARLVAQPLDDARRV